MGVVEITTNNTPRDVIQAWELSDSERESFDHIDWHKIAVGEESDPGFLRYKGTLYSLDDFTTTAGLDGTLDMWDGYVNWTYFSGIVVRFVPGTEMDQIIVGRYFVS